MAVESARVEVEAHYQRVVIRRDVDAAPVENHPVEFEIVADLEDRLILEQPLQLGEGESGVDLRRAIRKQVVSALLQRAVAGAAAIGRQADDDEVGGRSEQRRVGKECFSTGRTRGAPYLYKNN